MKPVKCGLPETRYVVGARSIIRLMNLLTSDRRSILTFPRTNPAYIAHLPLWHML